MTMADRRVDSFRRVTGPIAAALRRPLGSMDGAPGSRGLTTTKDGAREGGRPRDCANFGRFHSDSSRCTPSARLRQGWARRARLGHSQAVLDSLQGADYKYTNQPIIIRDYDALLGLVGGVSYKCAKYISCGIC